MKLRDKKRKTNFPEELAGRWMQTLRGFLWKYIERIANFLTVSFRMQEKLHRDYRFLPREKRVGSFNMEEDISAEGTWSFQGSGGPGEPAG